LKSDVEAEQKRAELHLQQVHRFLTGAASALITVWLIKELWPEAWG